MSLGSDDSVLVIGGGQAGGWAVKTLRDEGFAGRVTLVTAEAHLPYERPPLSKAVLLGEVAAETTQLFPPDTYRELDVKLLTADPVVKLSLGERTVVTQSGAGLSYDRLILCSGGRPRRPGIRGVNLPGVYVLRTLEDAAALREEFKTAKRIAVIGGGWIGLETAAVARSLGIEVLLIESSDRLCARSVPSFISDVIHQFHLRSGVDIRLSTQLNEIAEGAGGGLLCRLDDGSDKLVCAVVIGVGLIPNDELARDAGLNTRNGVVVDEYCQTSDPFIFAAGDVALGPLMRAGEAVRLESWQNAQDQAIAAARNALGIKSSYRPLPWFWSDQHGLLIQTVGLIDDDARCVIRGSIRGSFVAFFLLDEKVVAAVGCNAPRDLRIAKRLIEKGRTISEFDLSDPSVSLSAI